MSSSDLSNAFIGNEVSEGYERYMAPQLFEPWARRLIALAGVKPGDRVLDVAAGTGIVARTAAAIVGESGSIVATDISDTQLAVCAKKAPPSPPAAPITTLESSAEAIDVGEGSFDVALCQQGMQFFPDQPGAAAAMHRALRPGGVAAISVWAKDAPAGFFQAQMDVLAAMGCEEPVPGAFDMTTFQMQGDELARLLSGAGFRDVVVETPTLTAQWADRDEAARIVLGSPFAPLIAAMTEERRDEFLRRFTDAIPEHASAPSTAHLVRGTK